MNRVRPTTLRSSFVARLWYQGDTVFAMLPEYNERFQAVVKSLRYQWDRDSRHWWRTIERRALPVEDRLVELAVHLVAAGFMVELPGPELARRVVERDYSPEPTRWVLLNRHGNLVLRWGRDESFAPQLRVLPGATVYSDRAVLHVDLWQEVLDFAEQHGFRLDKPAQAAIERARAAYESAFVTDVEPLPAVSIPEMAEPESVTENGIDIELLDDELDDLEDND